MKSALDGVRFMRADRPIERTPVLYEPGIVIVCQGSKRGYLAGRVYHYDARQFLVLPVPLPFCSETDATPDAPMLAIAVRLDLTLAAELLLLLNGSVEANFTSATVTSSGMVCRVLPSAPLITLMVALKLPAQAAACLVSIHTMTC